MERYTSPTPGVIVMILLALVASGCDGPASPSAPPPPPSLDTPFVLAGIVRESGTGTPVPDLNVCWYDEQCARTKSDGSYRLDGPHRSGGGHIDQCPFVYGDEFEIRQNCLDFTYPESPWNPTVQRVIRIEAGQSVAATIFADDISGLQQEEDYCAGCKRVRVRAVRAGSVTVRVVPNAAIRVSFGYVDQRLDEPFAVQAGQELPIAVISAGASFPRSFELSTVFVPN